MKISEIKYLAYAMHIMNARGMIQLSPNPGLFIHSAAPILL